MADANSGPEIPRYPLLSRREALRNIAVGAGAFASGIVIGQSTTTPRTVERVVETRASEKIYISGETIENPVASIKIEGWNLVFDKEKLGRYQSSPDRVAFVLVGAPFYTPPDMNVFRAEPVIRALPSPEFRQKGLIYLHFTETDKSGGIVRSEVYPIKLKYYSTPKKDEFETPRIFSEVQLDPDLLEKAKKTAEALGQLSYYTPIYIYKNDDPGRGGDFDPSTKRIDLPSIMFTDPVFKDEGIIRLSHEMAHAIMSNVINNHLDPRLNVMLVEVYKNLVLAAATIDPKLFTFPMRTFSLFGAPEEVRNNPYFSIFSESSYVKTDANKDVLATYSHPFSNHDELFASALTVLRSFPDQFIARYMTLDPKMREPIREVVQTIIGPLPQESEGFPMKDFLPAYDRLIKSLSIKVTR